MNFLQVFFIIIFLFLCPFFQSVQIIINSTAHTCNPSCDGSQAKPFQTFIQALNYINPLTISSIELIFVTSQNNSYSLNPSDLSQLTPDNTTALYYIASSVNNLSLMPETCLYQSNSQECTGPNVNLSLNTEMIVFQPISDLVLYHIDLISTNIAGNNNSNTGSTIIYSLFTVKNNFKLLNSSITNLIANNYSYLAYSNSKASFTIENSTLDSLSFSRNLFLSSFSNSIFLISQSNFDKINSSCLFASNVSNQNIWIYYTYMTNIKGNIMSFISSNTILISFSMFKSLTSSSSASPIQFSNQNNINFLSVSFYSFLNLITYGGVINLQKNNNFNISNCTIQTVGALVGGFLYALENNNITASYNQFSYCYSVYDAGVFYLDIKNFFTGNLNYYNENKGWKGGAIYSNDSNVIMSSYSKYFKNNAFYLGNKQGGLGGAICLNKSSNIILDYETFDSNFVDGDGGAIYSNYSNVINITSSIFFNNVGYTTGGGISFALGLTLVLRNCSFLENQANGVPGWGGAGYCYSGSTEIYDSYFSKNTAVHASTWFTNVYGFLKINNMTVNSSSTAWGLGGMFYWYLGNQANITNSTFLKSNIIPWSISWVGGVFAFDKNNTFTLKNIIIEDSLTASIGGVFYIFTLNVGFLYNVTMKNSVANNAAGVFYVGESNFLHMESLSSEKSSSPGVAGFMDAENYNVIIMINVRISQSMTATGGVIYSNKNNSFLLDDCNFFDSNSSEQSGMFGTWTLNYIVIKNSKFWNGKSKTSGFTYLITFNTVLIYNTSFSNFSAEGFGGIIGTFQSNNLEIYNSMFVNSYCQKDGGAIFLENSNSFTIEGSLFQNSSAGDSGGVFVFSNQNTVKMKLCIITTSNSLKSGGSFFIVTSNTITIESSIFEKSELNVHGSGGFFSISQQNILIFKNNSYLNSKSTVSGGVFDFGSSNNYTEISSRFENISISNSAQFSHDGACFQIGTSNLINITDCEFVNIKSGNSGGIFYSSLLNKINASGVRFSNISVIFAGAILYAEEQNNCIFTNFTGQTLLGDLFGTGYYVLFSNIISMRQFSIENIINTGSAGGLIYAKDQNQFEIENCDVSAVYTQSSGGFLYAENNNNFRMIGLNLINFTSVNSGTVIFLSRNNILKLNSSKISKITSGFRGAMLYAIGGNTIVIGSVKIFAVNGFDIGCLFYFSSFNVISFENSTLNDSQCYSTPGNIIFLADGNVISFLDSQIHNFEFSENVDYFYGVSNNSIIMINNTISSNYSQIFFNLINNHSLQIDNMKILPNSTFNTFVYLSNGTMKINKLIIKFQVYHAVFHLLQDSFVNIKRSIMIPSIRPKFTPTSNILNASVNTKTDTNDFQASFNTFILIYMKDSKLFLRNSEIINTVGINLNPIAAWNSVLYLKKIMSFGANTLQPGGFGYFFDTSVYFFNNLLIESKSLSGGCISMNFSNDISSQNMNLSQVIQNSLSSSLTTNDNNIPAIIALNMTRNTIKLNQARLEGGAILFSIKPTVKVFIGLSLSENIFHSNKAWTGGAISLNNVGYGMLSNNSFIENRVEKGKFNNSDGLKYYYSFVNSSQAKGGALHTKNTSGVISQKNRYQNNTANIGGAIYGSTPFFSVNDSFINNTAEFYGANSASLVKNLTFLLAESLYSGNQKEFTKINYAKLEDLASGYTSQDCLIRIAGLDEFSNLVFNSDQQDSYASYITFKESTNFGKSYSSTIIHTIDNGQLCIKGAQRNQLPLQIAFIYELFLNSNPTNLILSLSFRNCRIGERLTDDFKCVECSPGYYSFQTIFTETSICLPCTDQDPFVCLGGNKLSPKPGYWRSDPNSKNFLQCPKIDACIPYNETLYQEASNLSSTSTLVNDINVLVSLGAFTDYIYTGNCETGFSGPYCNSCGQEYGKMGKMNCILCADSSWFYYFLIVLQIVLKIWYLFYCVLMAFKMIIAITLKSASEGAVIAINMLKILVIHIQILSFLLKIPLDWSDNLKTYLPILFSFSPDISESFNFECFMKSIGWTLSEQYFILILCPIYIILIFIVSMIFVGIRKNASKNPTVQRLSNFKLGLCVFFIIIILTYIDLSKVNLEMFQCLNIADPNKPDYRLVNDVEVDCNSYLHDLWKFILAVPMLFAIVILVVFLVGKLTYNFFKKKMDSKEIKLEFGYFYYAYKRKYYFWDFVILMRRLLILFFFLFFYEDLMSKSMFPILLMILTLFGSLGLQIFIHPFETEFEIVNDAEQYSLISLCLSYVIMMMYATFYFNDYVIPESLFFLSTLAILFINIGFLAFWMRNYYIFYFSRKLRTFVQTLKDNVRQSRVVWLEKLQKEHHVIFKIHNYLFKKQFLIGSQQIDNNIDNEKFDDLSKKNPGMAGLYTMLLCKVLVKSDSIPKEFMNHDIFECKNSNMLQFEEMIHEKKVMNLRLGKSNLKQAIFNEEVQLYESPLGKFCITFCKMLKGRNYYTYQLVTEIKVVGEMEGDIEFYDVEKKPGN